MKTRLLLISSAVLALASCSTYKAGQTPDDVYYSPARKVTYAETQQQQPRDGAQDEYVDMSDRYLRMKAANPTRWSTFDEDYMYWNNPTWNNAYAFNSFYSPYYSSMYSPYGMSYGMGYGMSFGMGYGGYYGSMFGYPGFYGSPFYPGYYGAPIIVVGKPVYHNPAAYGPRTYNLNTYANPARPVSAYGHVPSSGSAYRGTDRNGNAAYVAPVRVFGSAPATTNGGSSYRGGTYRGTDGSGYQNAAPRTNSNFGNTAPARSFNSGGSSGGSSAPARSFHSGRG